MTRLRNITKDELDARGLQLWEAIAGSRGSHVITAENTLGGPFNAFLHSPEVGSAAAALGKILRFESSIDRRLNEVAIITVGAYWKAEYEWWAHSRLARELGVADEVIEAIGDGTAPPFTLDDERIVHEAAYQLVRTGHLDDATYGRAFELLGETAMMELVALCGYYTLISFTLNAFAVPLPPGVSARWPAD